MSQTRTFQSYMDEGNQYYKKKEYLKAANTYTNALNIINPSKYNKIHADAFYWLGMIYNKLDKGCKLSVEFFNKAININPQHKGAYIGNGWYYYNVYVELIVPKKRFLKFAIWHFTQAYSIHFREKLVDYPLPNKDVPKALVKTIIYEAIKKHPDRKRRIELYEFCLNEDTSLGAILKNPRNTLLGHTLFECQECNISKGTLKKIAKQLALEYATVGEDKFNAREEQNAFEDFAKALNRDVDCGNAYLGKGKYHAKIKNYENAKFDFNQAIRCFTLNIDYPPNDMEKEEVAFFCGEAHFSRGLAYSELGFYANAIMDFNKAIKTAKFEKISLSHIKEIFLKILQLEKEAQSTFECNGSIYILKDIYKNISPADLWKSMEHFSSIARVTLYERSNLIKQRLGEAENFLKTILQTLADDYTERAMAQYSLGKLMDAVDDYQIALQYVPDHPIASKQLQRIKQVLRLYPVKAGFIGNLDYDAKTANKAKDKSAHDVREIEKDNLTYYFKPENSPHLAHLGALANRFYRMMLPWNIAPSKAYVDATGNPVGLISKGIPSFKTFRDIKKTFIKEANGDIKKGEQTYLEWFSKYLSHPKNYRQFYKMCIVARYRREDDLHDGNFARHPISGKLYFFDTDESMLDVRSKLTGGRFGVDTLGSLSPRDPQTAFTVDAEDIRNFPHLTIAKPHYFPGRQAYLADISKPFTENVYSDDIIKLVQTCETITKIEKLQINFKISLRGMLYYYPFFTGRQDNQLNHAASIAALDIPLDAKHKNGNLIDMIVKGENNNDTQFWSVFSSMPEFQLFLEDEEKNGYPALYKNLLICLWHNRKLEKSAKKHPERVADLTAAIFPLEKMILNYNKLMVITERNLKKSSPFENFVKLKEIDPHVYLNTIASKLEKDLHIKQFNYDLFFNLHRKKRSMEQKNNEGVFRAHSCVI